MEAIMKLWTKITAVLFTGASIIQAAEQPPVYPAPDDYGLTAE